MIQFDHPWLLAAAPVAALLLTALALWARLARIGRARRWSEELGATARRVGRLTPLALGLVAFAAVTALAGPRWGRRTVRAESKALDLVIVVDISRSMLAEDVTPSRLGRARIEARRLVHDLAGDRIGLVAFSGQSYILSPLTIDGSALQLLIDALDPNMASAGGTELGAALRQGADLLQGGSDLADRVLVGVMGGFGQRFAEVAGAFGDPGADGEAVRAPAADPVDGPTPAGAFATADALLGYAALTGSARHREAAVAALGVLAPVAARYPRAAGAGLVVAEAVVAGPAEIAVVGPARDPRTVALHRTALLAAPPGAVIALGPGGAAGDGDGERAVPLLAGRSMVGGVPAAYVCRNFTCRTPVTDPLELREVLAYPAGAAPG